MDVLGQERAYADRTFDEAELEVTSFSQEVSKLMNTDAFQMLKKIMPAAHGERAQNRTVNLCSEHRRHGVLIAAESRRSKSDSIRAWCMHSCIAVTSTWALVRSFAQRLNSPGNSG